MSNARAAPLPRGRGAHTQDEARDAIASPVEHIADSLDAGANVGNGAQMTSAVKGDFGEYKFHGAQLKALL